MLFGGTVSQKKLTPFLREGFFSPFFPDHNNIHTLINFAGYNIEQKETYIKHKLEMIR